ncbi:MAG: acyl-CoA thioesterase [Haloferacaceae archaeon]
MTRYAYETEIDVRYRDLDSLGHVNNAVYATYFELARLRYLRNGVDAPAAQPNFVVAHLELDFRRPITDISTVSVGLGVVEVGETSFRIAYEVRSEGTVSAQGETVQVTVDEDGSPTAMPDSWRSHLETERDRSRLEFAE